MEIFPLTKVKPGDRLARSIYGPDGRLLLAEGVSLTGPEIHRLTALGIPAVYVDDGDPKVVLVDDIVREETKAAAAAAVAATFAEIDRCRTFEVRDVRLVCERMIDDIMRVRRPVVRMVDIRSLVDHTFGHSVGVCVLSLILGRRLGLRYSDLVDLGVGALLHDVGRAVIAPELWMKTGPLSPPEWRRIRRHPKAGFDLLRNIPEIRVLSAHIAYQHHERWDGSGYPRGLSREEIHLYSRIVAVADVFDALTHARPHRPAIAVHHALRYLTTHTNQLFDGKIVNAMMQCVAPYPIGTRIRLAGGATGVIAQINPESPDQPVVVLDDKSVVNLAESDEAIETAISGWGIPA